MQGLPVVLLAMVGLGGACTSLPRGLHVESTPTFHPTPSVVPTATPDPCLGVTLMLRGPAYNIEFAQRGSASDPLINWRFRMNAGRDVIARAHGSGCVIPPAALAGYSRIVADQSFRIAPIAADTQALLRPFIEDLAVNVDPVGQLQDQKTIDELILAYQAARRASGVRSPSYFDALDALYGHLSAH
jgi:hypothetical protein